MSSNESNTRTRILETTWHLMEKRRGRNVRIEDIAQVAGVSRQAVYLHFGSRATLLIATARYLDEVMHVSERLQHLCDAKTGIQVLDAYVEFWADYIPDIYGLARALMNARDTDKAAEAAWNDRMQAVYDGCLQVVRTVAEDGVLAPEWTVDDATDFLYATISIQTWETLTLERGWSNAQFVERTQQAVRKALVQTA